MNPPYAVVTFIDDVPADNPDDEITSEVPSSWITKDQQHCWWPSSMKNVTVLISKQAQPQVKDKRWQLCKIKLDAYYDDLEAARKKAQTLSSSDENEEHMGRGQRRKRKVHSPQLEDNSLSSEDLPVEKRRVVLATPPHYEVEVEDNDLRSMIDIPITFEDAIGTESHLEATSSGSKLTTAQSAAAISEIVVFDALLSSTSDTSDPMIKFLTPPSRVPTNGKLPLASSVPSTAGNTDSMALLSSPLPCAGSNDKLPFDSPVSSGLSKTGPSSELNRKCTSVQTPKRPPSNLFRRFTGGTSKTLTVSTQDPDSSVKEIIAENTAKVLNGIAVVISELEKFNERLEKLENQIGIPLSVSQSTNHPPELSVLPFQTTDQIETFEANLLNHAEHPLLKSNLMKFLIRVGGNGLKDNTIRVLKTVFSNKVAVKSSWLGLRKNFQISKLNITKMIKDAVAVKHPHTDKEFEELSSEWFRQANQRFKREQKDQEN